MKTEYTIKVGAIVQYQFDTGAFGLTTLFGIVEQAGEKTFTVRWESGIRNRVSRLRKDVTLTTNPELLQEARKACPEAQKGTLAGLVESRVNRVTKTKISLYRSLEAGIDGDPELPWTTVCEAHDAIIGHPSYRLARSHMAMPERCEDCQKILEAKGLFK